MHRTGAVQVVRTAVVATLLIGASVIGTAGATAGATVTPSLFPVPGSFGLTGIACPSTSDCLAIGYGSSGSFVLPYVDGELSDGQLVPGDVQLDAITCPTASDCFAVGTVGDFPVNPPNYAVGAIVPILNGEVEPVVTVTDTSELTAIGCVTATTQCTAVGVEDLSDTTTPFREGVVVELSDGTPTGSTVHDGAIDHFTSVACPSSSSCLAAGLVLSGSAPGVVTVSGGVPSAPVDLTGFGATPATTVCPTATQCWVAGGDDVVGVASGVPGTPTTATGLSSLVSSVCTSTTTCDLTGSTSGGAGAVLPITGTSLGTVDAVSGTTSVAGLACPDTACVAAATASGPIGVLATDVEVASAPTVTAVAFSGTTAAPTVTVTGTGFGDAPPAPSPLLPLQCVAGDTSYDFTAGALAFADTTGNWTAGEPSDCVGLVVDSWSPTQVVLGFGADYGFPPLHDGDHYTLTVLGTSSSGTASITSAPSPTITGVAFTGVPSDPVVTVTGTDLGATAPPADPTGPLTCMAGDTSHTYAGDAFSFADTTQGWTAGVPGDCLGLVPVSWSATSVVFGFGAYYPEVGALTTGDAYSVGLLGATFTGRVGSTGPAPTISHVTIASVHKGANIKVTVKGTGFGATAPSPNPSGPLTCVAGDTSHDYPVGDLSFSDETDGWTAGVTGDCVGLVVSTWSAKKVVFTLGTDYSAFTKVAKGDQYQLTVLGAVSTGTSGV